MILVDAEVAALVLRVTPRCIQKWVATGRYVNHGTPRRIRLDLHALTPD